MTLFTSENYAPVLAGGAGEPWTNPSELPQLTTTVPREYVHRSSVAEVFLTGYERIDENVYLLHGQWPRAHTFFTSVDGASHDPVQAAETIRQAGLLLCHSEYGVPLKHKMLLWTLDFTADPSRLHIGTSPTELQILATCRDFAWKGNKFSGVLEVTLRIDGVDAASGTATFSCVSSAVYRRLRGEAGFESALRPLPRQTPVPAAEAGRLLPADVVLAPADRPGRWLLSPDLGHPILFEHANDHHPGMVLVEAARQAAYATLADADFTPTGIDTAFRSYAEFDAPCWIDAEPVHTGDPLVRTVRVTGHQDGRTVFESTVTGTLPPR
ncbi:ScbA/BarX family gamma-butyrolactone biosynthesis protein [Streptomyces sp. NBC_01565]|uniref:ScbA/BarX family gamma-butyrolactone biosynthesis protein n=1 Tax=unclassified Streptomyces TaxID=2593676 RepID=UPI002254744C|nr:ScbA/BarX family gamma-butyrolactone biosynthesis protein [Streptomyces sp. NBC_01565]MCX4545871.1 ScbA/BarX family gamma-butyrolactone biosynthesis protein [Streptomyces sp. NBC_01565]